MKTLMTKLILTVLLISCGNSHLFDPEQETDVQAGNASGNGVTTTTNILPPFGGGTVDAKLCQHLDAVDFDSSQLTEPGPCTFTACNDNTFAEFDVREDFQNYIDKHGGKILDDPGACQTKKGQEGYCYDMDAYNFGAYESCLYSGCSQEGFYEYIKYQELIAKHGEENVEKDDSLCQTPIHYPGCTSILANNLDLEADVDDGSCKFSLCDDESYEEYDAGTIAALVLYANEHELNLEEINNSAGQCVTKINTPGCMVEGTLNYNSEATIDNGTCKWSACIDESYEEYDSALAILIENYAQTHSVDISGIVISTCNTLKKKCDDERATNTGAFELCHYNVCDNSDYQEYQLYLEVKEYVENGSATMTVSEDFCHLPTIKPGCTKDSAENTTIGANQENGTCRWKACLDSNYSEFNASLDAEIRAYALVFGEDVSTYYESTCSTLNVKKGCKNDKAVNYDSTVEVDDGTCVFKLCTDCKYKEFGPNGQGAAYELTKIIAQYATTHEKSFSSLVVNSCQTPIGAVGCTDPYAKNYRGNAWSENKSCVYKACLSGSNYSSGQSNLMTDIINAYATEHSLSITEVSNSVLNSSNGKVYVERTCHEGARKLVVKLSSECLNNPYNSVYIKVMRAGEQNHSRPLTTPQSTAVYDVTNGQSYSIELINGGSSVYHFSNSLSISGSISGDTIHEVQCN